MLIKKFFFTSIRLFFAFIFLSMPINWFINLSDNYDSKFVFGEFVGMFFTTLFGLVFLRAALENSKVLDRKNMNLSRKLDFSGWKKK